MNDQPQAETRDFQLPELLERVTRASGKSGEEPGSRLNLIRYDGVPSWVHGDGERLEKALHHLVRHLSCCVEGADFLLSIGLDYQTMDTAFLRFELSLVDGPSMTVFSGSRGSPDLGAARGLVQDMGGRMEGPLPDSGRTLIRLSIPFSLPATDPGGRLEELPPSLRRRVLLAEDNRVTQLATRKLLERRGHEVQTANDGWEAVEKAMTIPFDVVLMDLEMPGLDGLAAAGKIRSANEPTLPIVAYTVHTHPADQKRCGKAGVKGFLAKPVTTTDLFREVERWPSRCDA